MKALCFIMMAFSIVLLMAPESAYSQNLHMVGNTQERTEPDSQGRFDTGSILTLFTHVDNNFKLLQVPRYKGIKFWYAEGSDDFNDNYKQGIHLTMDETTGNKLELVKKMHPQLYNLYSKKYNPGSLPSSKKNDFKIAEQLLMIIYPTLESNYINRVVNRK